ncbi:hypothetical protein [Flagellimonas onchidii]|uniref:hypothetical protein n=1 Tax=Flagellimonas onchidii TaxID=2562684 RepID=UPI0010A62207|nr:hypothetical protein [Allomuricauda onchidii]
MQVYGAKGVTGNFVRIGNGSPQDPSVWLGTEAQLALVNPRDQHTLYITTDGGVSAEGQVYDFLSGVVAPVVGGGGNGDVWLNTLTGDLYKKENDAWGLLMNIKGAQGDQGVQGVQGVAGVNGIAAIVTSVETLNIAGGVDSITALPADVDVNITKLDSLVLFDGFIDGLTWNDSQVQSRAGTLTLSGLANAAGRNTPFRCHAYLNFGSSVRFFPMVIGNDLSIQVHHDDVNPAGLTNAAKTIYFSGHYMI